MPQRTSGISRRELMLAPAALPVAAGVAAASTATPAEEAVLPPGAALGAPWFERTFPVDEIAAKLENGAAPRPFRVELTGGKWIWLPCGRTLPNTFVLFRRDLDLASKPTRALAWIAADSRYRLTVNGRRVQWGPAPCDPRELDADPVDLTTLLEAGKNVIGVEVLFYGAGDGTWPAGKPGLLFHLALETSAGTERITSDRTWRAFLDRSHPPGMHKRWFLRALQEEYDARLRPEGWDTPGYSPDERWMEAAEINCPADKPPSSAPAPYSGDTIDTAAPELCSLRAREIGPVRETVVRAKALAESGRVNWLRDPEDWFDARIAGSFRLDAAPCARQTGEAEWELPATATRQGVYATFEFAEQMVGFPGFTIDAPAGTIIEMMTQESHDARKTRWLDSHFYAWSRYICREGVNRFEAFDYESLRWLQLHVRNAGRPVRVSGVQLRRREFPWPNAPHIRTSDPALQRLFDAGINTLRNSVIETAVDGMGRERQQYSGDGGHQLHAVRYAFGDTSAPRRYLRTFSSGQMKDGYFADSWPAFDRLARVAQKQVDGAFWGPLLDHAVGFNFDCWNHYMESGDAAALAEPYPHLKRFAAYLDKLVGPDGLLPVEDLGIPTVWMDHVAYKRPRHKQCAFNLYAAAMLRHALAPIAEAMRDEALAATCRRRSDALLAATVRRFWSRNRGLFVANLPWSGEEREIRLCDRSLATSVLFDQCPAGETRAAVRALAEVPPEMGLSYPCNAGWRYWALAKAGRAGVVIGDLRKRWAPMPSVLENNTIQEDWEVAPDSTSQWSHCGVAPIYVLFMDIAGIRPLAPGFSRCRIRPQLGDLPDLELASHTPHGPIRFSARLEGSAHRVTVELPKGCEAELVGAGGKPRLVRGGETAEVLIPKS